MDRWRLAPTGKQGLGIGGARKQPDLWDRPSQRYGTRQHQEPLEQGMEKKTEQRFMKLAPSTQHHHHYHPGRNAEPQPWEWKVGEHQGQLRAGVEGCK